LNYNKLINYILNNFSLYNKLRRFVSNKINLNNIKYICDSIGNPQSKFTSIHIGGTNGKGSTSHSLSSIFQCSGYSVGLYTSPHLISFRERIKFNGCSISKDYVLFFLNSYLNLFKELNCSFFEIILSMSFHFFSNKNIDIGIFEVGMGGKLDTTNIIIPQLSIITNINLDHVDFLGKNLFSIAYEKSGIIKDSVPVIIGRCDLKLVGFLKNIAKLRNSRIYFSFNKYFYNFLYSNFDFLVFKIFKHNFNYSNIIFSDLAGYYQIENIVTVINAIDNINNKFNISNKNLIYGLKNIKKLTNLRCRWEIIKKNPTIIFDVGHNLDSIRFLINQIEFLYYDKIYIVFGFLLNKNIFSILKIFPNKVCYYFCKFNNFKMYFNNNLNFKIFHTIKDAFKESQLNASKNDLIFVLGGSFLISDIL